MRITRLLAALAIVAAMSLPAFGQNRMLHYDGTTEATGRSTVTNSGGITVALMQRVPGDQLCGATSVKNQVAILQDQNYTTGELVTFEVRSNNVLGAVTGEPDMSAAGLLGSAGPFLLNFPVPASGVVSAAGWTVTYTTPIAISTGLAAQPMGVPAADIYIGTVLTPPSAGAWPTTDGASMHFSTIEQNSATTIGYTGAQGVAGLSWYADISTAAPPVQGGPNGSWYQYARYTNDMLQPSADNPGAFTGGVLGVNPNLGYAGLLPDALRLAGPDGLSWHLRATTPVGTQSILFAAFSLQPSAIPASFLAPSVSGFVCLGFLDLFVVTTATTGPMPASYFPPDPATCSEAVFGPFPGSPQMAGLGAIHFQAFTGNVPNLQGTMSQMCTSTF